MIRNTIFTLTVFVSLTALAVPALSVLECAFDREMHLTGLGFSRKDGFVARMYVPVYGRDSVGRHYESASERYSFRRARMVHIEHFGNSGELLSVFDGLDNRYNGLRWGTAQYHDGNGFNPPDFTAKAEAERILAQCRNVFKRRHPDEK